MDLIKKLTGKNPSEYEIVAKNLVDNSDVNLFQKLVKQDEFLFDFIKQNVAKRIRVACSKDNYQHLLNFFEYHSSSYDDMFAEVLYEYGGLELLPVIKEFFYGNSDSAKAYAIKFFMLVDNEYLQDIVPLVRETAKSNFEPLAINSIELLSKINDEISKNEALDKLKSSDEFEQYNAIKFLVIYQATDVLDEILNILKKSSFAENIAAEIPYLIQMEDLLKKDFDAGILVLCNIVNAIPDIIPPSAVIDYNLYEILGSLYKNNLSSSVAVLLRIAKDKFAQLLENEEYLFDCDKNTKDEVVLINKMLSNINELQLESLLYEELYEESDFVFFALDYVNEIAELEALIDSKNQTLILKVLTILKEKQVLTNAHKELAISKVSSNNIKEIIEVL